MMKVVRQSAIMALCITVTLVFAFAANGMHADAKTKKVKRPTKIIAYDRVNGNWVKSRTDKLSYNKKGDLVKVGSSSIKNKYKKGKKVSAISYDMNLEWKFDKKGRDKQVGDAGEGDGGFDYKITYNKKNRIQSVKQFDYGETDSCESTYTFRVSKSGRETTITCPEVKMEDEDSVKYINENESEVRVYNAKGLLLSVNHSIDDNPRLCYNIVYGYKKKGSLVTAKTITVSINGEVYTRKLVYKYGKKKMKHSDYIHMINKDERTVYNQLFEPDWEWADELAEKE